MYNDDVYAPRRERNARKAIAHLTRTYLAAKGGNPLAYVTMREIAGLRELRRTPFSAVYAALTTAPELEVRHGDRAGVRVRPC